MGVLLLLLLFCLGFAMPICDTTLDEGMWGNKNKGEPDEFGWDAEDGFGAFLFSVTGVLAAEAVLDLAVDGSR